MLNVNDIKWTEDLIRGSVNVEFSSQEAFKAPVYNCWSMPMFIVILNYNSEEHFCFQANWFFFSNIKKKKSLGIEVAWIF